MPALKETIKQLADEAQRGCGLVWELYIQRFSEAVDSRFPATSPQREEALRIAKAYDYATPKKRYRLQTVLAKDGCCSHGLDPDCCPMGCGDSETGEA
ncbi:hypothetical protein D3C71_19260 [compost metagenome]